MTGLHAPNVAPIRTVAVVVIALVLVTACGGGSGDDTSPPAPMVVDPGTSSQSPSSSAQVPGTCDSTAGIEGGGRQKLSGVLSAIKTDGGLVISNVAIATSSAQVFVDGVAGGVTQLRTGEFVTVTGTIDASGQTGCAGAVYADADITGVIDAVDSGRRTLSVLGQEIRVAADTVFGIEVQPALLSALAVGDRIRVSGLQADGAIAATRIDRAMGGTGYYIAGIATNVDNQNRTFRVNAIEVHYDAATITGFADGAPRFGDSIRVTGTAFEPATSASGLTVVKPTHVERINYSAAVTMLPGSASVQVGGSVQFVVPSADTGPVTWSITGCASDCGVIDSTGLYIAPMTAHVAPGLLIAARSVASPVDQMLATVYVYAASPGIGVTPTSVTVSSSQTQQFAAYSATGSPLGGSPRVTWSLSGTGCAGSGCGTIDSHGVYVAPANLPDPAVVTITATDVTSATRFGSATVHLGVNPHNARLQGQYAFLLSGFDWDGHMMLIGNLTADGSGRIVSGSERINSQMGFFTLESLTGNYSVNADGRGFVELDVPVLGIRNLKFALAGPSTDIGDRARVTAYVGDRVLVGSLLRQDTSAFSLASLDGNFAFGLDGEGSSGNFHMVAAGRFGINGGNLNGGQIDVNNGGSLRSSGSLTGVLGPTVGSNGQFVLDVAMPSLPKVTRFFGYVISADELLLMQFDERSDWTIPGIAGTALRQKGAPYSLASLHGAGVMCLSGDRSPILGRLGFDGNGRLTGRLVEQPLDSTMFDRTVAGTYAVDTGGAGRGVMTVEGVDMPLPFYLAGAGRAFMIDGATRGGMLEPQSGGPFGTAMFAGRYVLGSLPVTMNWWAQGMSGVLQANGAGALTGTTDGAVTGQDVLATFTIAADGELVLPFRRSVERPLPILFYLTSPSRAIGIPTAVEYASDGCTVIER